MRQSRFTLIALLLAVLLFSGCGDRSGNPGGPNGPAGAQPHGQPAAQDGQPGGTEHPLRPYFITALEELRRMNDQGQQGNFQEAQVHFEKFREAWSHLAGPIGEKDRKLRIHVEQGIEELVIEFQKEKPRSFELDEENLKLSQLLEKGGKLLGVEVPPELVLRQPVAEIPFKHERVVEVTLDEYTVSPEVIAVEVDTRLTLRVTNRGQEVHELAVEHYGWEVEDIQPGETRELTFVTLDKGEFELACFLPGHYEAGMKALLIVK